MNQDGPEFLDRLWPGEAALDVLAAFGLPDRFLSYLRVLGSFSYFGFAREALVHFGVACSLLRPARE
jgi:hypothetical protein